MATVQTVTADLNSKIGQPIDADGVYGSQCVDTLNYVAKTYFGKMLWGNAIDLPQSAQSVGWKWFDNVVGDVNSKPQEGDFFIMDTTAIYGHPYGHVGYVLWSDGNTMKTLETNVDGNPDSLIVGGPLRQLNRDFSGVIGWIRPPYTSGTTDKKPTQATQLSIEQKVRVGIPQVGVTPYRQIHAHSTGNPNSTAQNEADYMYTKNLNEGFYTHVVGNGRIIQTAQTNRGAYDVGGGWNAETYAAVELIESHQSKEDFMKDYQIYVNLLRKLAQEAGLSIDLDSGDSGIISHAYATANQPDNASDHIDPYPYLAKWGISKEQFAKDLKTGFNTVESQEEEENDMFTISAKDRGIALITGGVFYALLDANDPKAFWNTGVKHIQVSQKTFDNFQSRSNVDKLDDETVNKLIKGINK